MSDVTDVSSDSSMYAHFLFEAFDSHNNGSVSFEVKHFINSENVCWSSQSVCSLFPAAGLRRQSVDHLERLHHR